MTGGENLEPSYARNMRLIGHSDQAGRSDGQQIMVRNGYAYIGHVCSKGFSVIDVRSMFTIRREGIFAIVRKVSSPIRVSLASARLWPPR